MQGTRGTSDPVPFARVAAWIAAASLLLAACSPGTPGPTPVETIALQGLWRVAPDARTVYGAGGTTTLQFGASSTGSAAYLSRADANGITTCERHVYAALSRNVVLLDGEYYEATAVGADRIELDSDDAGLVLTRVSGAPPVAPCATAEDVEVARLDGAVVIGGYAFDQPGVNHVFTLHADTLAPLSQREVLPQAYFADMAWFDGRLAALVGHTIVIVGADGMAETTIALEGTLSDFPRGLTAIGSTFYVLDRAADGDALLYAVEAP